MVAQMPDRRARYRGYAEVQTGGGWRAVTKDGVQSGPGNMDYDHDMPPYIHEMADWLDDDRKEHPSSFARAYQGFDIMSAMYRSVVEGRQIPLPLESGMDEIAALKAKLPAGKVIMTLADSAKSTRNRTSLPTVIRSPCPRCRRARRRSTRR